MMPFPGGIEATENATLLIVLAASALYAFLLNTRAGWLRTIVKTIPVALLCVLTGLQNGPILLAAALGLSAAGDAVLSRENASTFVYGLGFFLLAQLAYAVLFYLGGLGHTVLLTEWWRAGLAAVSAVISFVMLGLLLARVPSGLRLPIVVYIIAILAMGLAALTTTNLWVIGGAIAFIVSDALLATEKFLMPAISPHREWMRLAVWILYIAAQLALTLGILLGG